MISGRVQGQARLKSDLVPRVALQAHLRSNYVPLAAFGPWTPYTPILTALTGAFTSANANGRFLQIGKLVFFSVAVNIVTNGTAGGGIIFSLPVTAIAAVTCIGRDDTVTGKVVLGVNSGANNVVFFFYDNTYPGANGAQFQISGTYEAL